MKERRIAKAVNKQTSKQTTKITAAKLKDDFQSILHAHSQEFVFFLFCFT